MVKYIKKRLRFSKSFPFVKIKSRSHPSLIIVKDLRMACVTEAEKVLYDQLRKRSYYPTPHYLVAGVKMNLALVPYRLALIELNKNVNETRITKALKKYHWNVLFYETEQVVQHNEEMYMNLIMKHIQMYESSQQVVY